MVDRLVNSEANTRRISLVDSCFGRSGITLSVPGRVLVGEGVLTKICRKRPKPRQFFLFNDILVYGNVLIGKKKYNKQHIIPLEEISIESIEDNGQYRNGWLIRTKTKSFIVYATTDNEKQEWMAHINKSVKDLLRKSGKKPVENHAAVWVPDAEAAICMHCKKTQFTMIVRRHHCRNCGSVVCGSCSSKKYLLPQQSPKPVRVCATCYENLNKSGPNKLQSDADDGVTVRYTAGGSLTPMDNSQSSQSSPSSSISAAAAEADAAAVAAATHSITLKTTDSSDDDDDDDDDDDNNNNGEADVTHYEPRFYGDSTTSSDEDSIAMTKIELPPPYAKYASSHSN